MNHSLAHLARSKLHSWQQGIHLNRKTRIGPHGCADVELLSERLQQLRLDRDYIKVCCPSVYQELERVCASCKLHRLCAQDLASGDVESGMRSYCPNAPTIDALVVNWVP
jgi:hypothetical protein